MILLTLGIAQVNLALRSLNRKIQLPGEADIKNKSVLFVESHRTVGLPYKIGLLRTLLLQDEVSRLVDRSPLQKVGIVRPVLRLTSAVEVVGVALVKGIDITLLALPALIKLDGCRLTVCLYLRCDEELSAEDKEQACGEQTGDRFSWILFPKEGEEKDARDEDDAEEPLEADPRGGGL